MVRLSRSTPPPSQLSSRVLREHRRLTRVPPPCHRRHPGCASRLQAVRAGCACRLCKYFAACAAWMLTVATCTRLAGHRRRPGCNRQRGPL